MAVYDKASLLALLGVVEVELLSTSVERRREFKGVESESQSKAVSKLFLGKDNAIQSVGEVVKSRPFLFGPHHATGDKFGLSVA